MARHWEADTTTRFKRRPGKSPQELGHTTDNPDSPDIWELENGDVAIIGRDLTDGVSVGDDERLAVIPRSMMVAARPDIPSV
ncbi:hypothetical protein [Streptomyces lydicus]|uniref:hypothetical protein n=1 Tax=Streptomyces lydicus TaxID=47763 RepID=UPI0037A1E31E